jgi:glycopeptide antibiotics resistance protein
MDLILVFGVVSALGCMNELLEYFLTAFRVYQVDGTDVWSDILANTLGAELGFGILYVYDSFFSITNSAK